MAKMKLIPSGKTLMGKGLPAIGGAIGSKLVKNLAKKVIKKAELQKFIPVVPLLVGAIMSDNGKPNGALQFVGVGMMATAGADLAGNFIPVLAGLEDVDLSGIFDETLNDVEDLSDGEDVNGPLDGPLDGAGESEEYGDNY